MNTNLESFRIPQIDGLRCFSILFVLGAHLNLLSGGAIGVDIFFVISGYLITDILLKEFQNIGSINIKNFYVRRIVRIMPAFVFLLLVYAGMIFIFVTPSRRHDHYMALLYAGTYAMNWTRVLGLESGIIGHAWSLAVEEQFYLIWPLFLTGIVTFSKRGQIFIVTVLIVASAIWRASLIFSSGDATNDHAFFGSDTRALQIFMGCLLAVSPMRTVSGIAAKTCALPAIGLATFAILGAPLWLSYLDSLIVAICAAWLIAAIHGEKSNWLLLFLGTGLVAGIGRLSYSLYLWHFPIILIVESRTKMPHAVLLFVEIALSFIAASISYFFIEKPTLRFKAKYSAAANSV